MRPTQSKNAFNSIYPETKNRKPTSAEKKEIERIRRQVDLVRDARVLGLDLLEEWEIAQ